MRKTRERRDPSATERGAQHGARSYLGELVRRHLLQRNAVDLDIVQRRDLVELLRPVVDVSHRASTAHWRAEVCAPAEEGSSHTNTLGPFRCNHHERVDLWNALNRHSRVICTRRADVWANSQETSTPKYAKMRPREKRFRPASRIVIAPGTGEYATHCLLYTSPSPRD